MELRMIQENFAQSKKNKKKKKKKKIALAEDECNTFYEVQYFLVSPYKKVIQY